MPPVRFATTKMHVAAIASTFQAATFIFIGMPKQEVELSLFPLYLVKYFLYAH